MKEKAVGYVPQHCHPKIREIHDYWHSIHPLEGLPGRQHFDPVDIPSLLSNICLIEIPAEGPDFRFRLMGTKTVDFFGRDFTGKLLVSAYRKATESQAFTDLCGAREDGRLRWWRGPASYVANREFVIIERIFLPFANDGAMVNMVLALLLAKYGEAFFQ
jgi:hypothetical protein